MENINKEVYEELVAMKQVGITVKKATLEAAKSDDLSEYDNMSISDIADLLIDLA